MQDLREKIIDEIDRERERKRKIEIVSELRHGVVCALILIL